MTISTCMSTTAPIASTARRSGKVAEQRQKNSLTSFCLVRAGTLYSFTDLRTDNVAGGPGSNYTLLGWSFGLIDDQGNMTASGPAIVNAGTTGDVTVTWNGLAPNTIYLGGISHNTPDGLVSLTVISVEN